MGGAIIIVSISVGLLEDVHVLILTVVTSGGLVDITLILGYILYIMFTYLLIVALGGQEAIIMCNHVYCAIDIKTLNFSYSKICNTGICL